MAMANGLVMLAQETKVGMLPCETLNSQHHVTFGTQVAQWIKKCQAQFCAHGRVQKWAT
jgi:hypothetical protein